MEKIFLYDEKDLLPRVADGDEAAFRMLYDRYRKRIYALGVFITKSESLGQELVQDVFLKVWEKRQQLRDIVYFNAWLRTVARNTAINYLRAQSVEKLGLAHLPLHEVAVSDTEDEVADDHIHLAVSDDGILWATTKSSLDKDNYPQLVMRVRSPEGNRNTFPYLNLTKEGGPGSQVVITSHESELVLAGHAVHVYTNKKRYTGRIAFGIIDTTLAALLVSQVNVIVPDTSLEIMINNITVPKAAFPAGGPWIILASDRKGNVYEADLKPFFNRVEYWQE